MTSLTMSRGATGYRGLGALTRSEARLFLRDAGAVVFAVIFPSILVVGVGLALPGMDEPITDMPAPWAGMLPIHLYVPIALAMAVATVTLNTLPVQIATAREVGVLRRLSTTPMRPQGVLVAQAAVSLGALAVATLLALAAAAVVFDAPAPQNIPLALVAYLLGAAATAGVGMLIAAIARKGSTAGGISMLVYFPMLFFAGMWTPGPLMPDAVATIARFTPLGAMTQGMTTAWFGGDMPWLELGVMAAYVVVLHPLAARLFRWS